MIPAWGALIWQMLLLFVAAGILAANYGMRQFNWSLYPHHGRPRWVVVAAWVAFSAGIASGIAAAWSAVFA